MSFIWHTFFFDPIYNTLVFFIDVVRGGDVGLAIICTVVLVKLLLLPLSIKAMRTQLLMREIQPKLEALKEKYKDQREMLALKTMETFREAKVNPLSSILVLIIQLPIIIALNLAVYFGGGVRLPEINTDLLYGFIVAPDFVNMTFLGFLDIAVRSIPLAILAGVTQFFATKLTLPELKPREKDAEPSFKEDFTRNMHMQMRYVMPVMIVFIAFTFSAAIALYLITSNLMMIAQEFLMRHKGLKPKQS